MAIRMIALKNCMVVITSLCLSGNLFKIDFGLLSNLIDWFDLCCSLSNCVGFNPKNAGHLYTRVEMAYQGLTRTCCLLQTLKSKIATAEH